MDSPHTQQSSRGDFCEGGGVALSERAAMIGCMVTAGDGDKIGGGANRRLRVTAAILSVVKVDSAEAIAASVIRSWACSIECLHD